MTDAKSPSGLLVVDKPPGMTSHDVVARVRRLAGTRKVGHAGTLDPMATGVLVLGLNRATRLLGHLTVADKRYTATVRLGATTVTDDAEGEVLTCAPAEQVAAVDEAAVREAFAALTGELSQVPSAVSAVKVDGQRAHRLVRAGADVVIPPRQVVVHSLEVSRVEHRGDHLEADLEVHCSSGTYVRALARDAGAALGIGGHLSALRRTAVGPVGVDEAVALHDLIELRAASAEASLPVWSMERTCERFFPRVHLDAPTTAQVRYGRRLALAAPTVEGVPRDRPVALLSDEGDFLALYSLAAADLADPPASDGTGTVAATPVAVFV